MEEVATEMLRVNSRVMSPGPLYLSLPPSPSPSSQRSFLSLSPSHTLLLSHYLAFEAMHPRARAFPRTHWTGRSSSFEFENTAISVTAPAAALCVHTYVYLVLHPVPTTLRKLPSFFPQPAIDRDVVCPSAFFIGAELIARASTSNVPLLLGRSLLRLANLSTRFRRKEKRRICGGESQGSRNRIRGDREIVFLEKRLD